MGLKKIIAGLAMVVAGFVGSTFAGTLTNFSYSAGTTMPNTTTTYTFTYTTESILTGGSTSMFVAYFPAGFTCSANLNDLNVTVNGSGVTPGGSTYFGSDCITIIRMPDTIDAGSNIVVTMSNVTNPNAGTYSFGYGPLTSFMGGQPIDQPTSVNALYVGYPVIANFGWSSSTSVPGATGSYTFVYSAVNAIPSYPNNLFYFWFPSLNHEWWTGSNLNNDISITINGTPSTGESSVQLGERFWVNINDAIPTGGSVSVTLNNVLNYGVAGTYNWTTYAQTTDGLTNETRQASSMSPIVLSYPPITLESALDWCNTNSGSINISYEECSSLAYLYDETDGNNWDNDNGWFTNTDISTWETSSCYSPVDGNDWCNGTFNGSEYWKAIALTGSNLSGGAPYTVYGINLPANGLQGSISSGLNNLTNLVLLDIQDNSLTGANVTHNTLLREFDISDNSQEVDSWDLDLSHNTYLRSLNVDDLVLYSIDLSHNTGLEYLDIDGNQLTGINLSGLNVLHSVDVSDNYIQRGSQLIITSPLLDYLDAGNNQLDAIDVTSFPLLTYLDAYGNHLRSIDISHNTGLDELYLSNNNITTITIANADDYDLSDSSFYYNGLCEITDTNVLNFLNTYVGEGWEDYQFFCPVRNLTVTPSNTAVTLGWNTPRSHAGSNDNSTSVIAYTVSSNPDSDDDDVVINLQEDYRNNTTHNWNYTFTGLTNNTAYTYTFTVCAVHTTQGPNHVICTDITATPHTTQTSGGGGGGSAIIDSCPNGDHSGSYYDDDCGDQTTQNDSSLLIQVITGSCTDAEYNAAYIFAFKYHITTMPSCLDANMDGSLTRAQAAKMMSNYAINILHKSPDNSKACVFSDMADQSPEMQQYAIAACRLGIMGLETDGVTPSSQFNPNDLVDKAQFATILDRLINGRAHDGNTTCWYCDHVSALQDAGVITITTDLFDPLKRSFAMIMLMRSKKSIYSSVDDTSSRTDLK